MTIQDLGFWFNAYTIAQFYTALIAVLSAVLHARWWQVSRPAATPLISSLLFVALVAVSVSYSSGSWSWIRLSDIAYVATQIETVTSGIGYRSYALERIPLALILTAQVVPGWRVVYGRPWSFGVVVLALFAVAVALWGWHVSELTSYCDKVGRCDRLEAVTAIQPGFH